MLDETWHFYFSSYNILLKGKENVNNITYRISREQH